MESPSNSNPINPYTSFIKPNPTNGMQASQIPSLQHGTLTFQDLGLGVLLYRRSKE